MNCPTPIPFAPAVAELDERFDALPWQRPRSFYAADFDLCNVGTENIEPPPSLRRTFRQALGDALIAVALVCSAAWAVAKVVS